MTGPDRRTSRRGRIRRPFRRREGLTLRAMVPNTVTAMALCMGLTGIRFAFLGNWQFAVACVILAGVLDGIDGRVARLMNASSRFGAELDSLSDCIAFGVAPCLIMYLWSLQQLPRFGWLIALAVAVCCALRLARFNARIDIEEQPHKSAGFLTGVPAPAGAGLAFLPIYLWLITGEDAFRHPVVVGPWILLVAFVMISNLATYSWTSLRLRKSIRLEAIAAAGLTAAAMLTAPWHTLALVSIIYLVLIPFGVRSYAKVRRQRAANSGA